MANRPQTPSHSKEIVESPTSRTEMIAGGAEDKERNILRAQSSETVT